MLWVKHPLLNQGKTKPVGPVTEIGLRFIKITSEVAAIALGNKMGIKFSL